MNDITIIWNKKSQRFKRLENITSLPNKEQGELIFWRIKKPNGNILDLDLNFILDVFCNYDIPKNKVLYFLDSMGLHLPETFPFEDI